MEQGLDFERLTMNSESESQGADDEFEGIYEGHDWRARLTYYAFEDRKGVRWSTTGKERIIAFKRR